MEPVPTYRIISRNEASGLRFAHIETPLRSGRFAISAGSVEAAETVLVEGPPVRLVNGDTYRGIGEAVPSDRVTGQDAATIQAMLTAGAKPTAKIVDPAMSTTSEAEPPKSPLGDQTGPAACAIDSMILDTWGHHLERPVWRALDLPKPAGTTCATVSIAEPDAMADEASHLANAGFRQLKLKLGGPGRTDIDRVQAVHEAVPRAKIQVDANEGWGRTQAEALMGPLADAGVRLVEQPLLRNASVQDQTALRRWAEDAGMQIFRDEGVTTPQDVERIASQRSADGVVVKLQKSGGLRPAVACMQLARHKGLEVLLGCFVETWAGIHLALQAAGLASHLDLDGAWLLADAPVHPAAMLLDGDRFEAPNHPGLGIRMASAVFDATTKPL